VTFLIIYLCRTLILKPSEPEPHRVTVPLIGCGSWRLKNSTSLYTWWGPDSSEKRWSPSRCRMASTIVSRFCLLVLSHIWVTIYCLNTTNVYEKNIPVKNIDRALQYITICRAGSGYVDSNVVVSNSGPPNSAEGEMRGQAFLVIRLQA
jgi:hypothetical protein